MNVYIVMVGPYVNSVWSERPKADEHVAHLIEVNGDQIAVRVTEIEVRS